MRARPLAAPTLALALAFALAGGPGCSAKAEPVQGWHVVDLSWAPNHERGVNAAGGGYLVSIDGRPDVDLPYASGDLAPTSITTTLHTGAHSVTVRAYAAVPVAKVSAPSVLQVQVF